MSGGSTQGLGCIGVCNRKLLVLVEQEFHSANKRLLPKIEGLGCRGLGFMVMGFRVMGFLGNIGKRIYLVSNFGT